MKFNRFFKNYHIEEVTSTSSILYENIDKISNMTFLSTDFQSEGKGRTNHTWVSERGKNLLFSFAIKDKYILEQYKILSVSLGSIVARYLNNIGVKEVSIKWPNDVYIKDKKVCGILLNGQSDKFIIAGIGLNLNQTNFGDINATSLRNELGVELSYNKVKRGLFKAIRRDIGFVRYFPRFLVEYARERNFLLNKEVDYEINNKKYHGVVYDIAEDASLLIKNDENKTAIDCGEVTLSNGEN